jgi:hypothetical protein
MGEGGEVKYGVALAVMASRLLSQDYLRADQPPQPPRSIQRPWHGYQVPKALRKGKTPGEIEELRKTLWERKEKSNET